MAISKNQLIVGGAVLGIAAFYFLGVRGLASGAGRAVVNAAGGVAEGVTYGVSDLIGLENPDLTKCEQAKLNGDTWQASFSCGAGDFLKYALGSNSK